MGERESLLAAYDAEDRRWRAPTPSPGVRYEQLGPILRVVGGERGFIDPAPDLGVAGDALDALICEQRDFFAARGEAVEWKTRGHDERHQGRRAAGRCGLRAGGRGDGHDRSGAPAGGRLGKPPDVVDPPGDGSPGFRANGRARVRGLVGGSGLDGGGAVRAGRGQPCRLLVFVAEVEVAGCFCRVADHQARHRVCRPTGAGQRCPNGAVAGSTGALVAHRAKLAASRSVRYLQVDASEESRPILSRLGLVAVTTTTPYVWSPT